MVTPLMSSLSISTFAGESSSTGGQILENYSPETKLDRISFDAIIGTRRSVPLKVERVRDAVQSIDRRSMGSTER